MKWAIEVQWNCGGSEYVRRGVCGGEISMFTSKDRAQEQADFLAEGLGEARVVVVPAPKIRRARRPS